MSKLFDMQNLINAQVEVARASFIANAQNNYATSKHLDDVSDEKVVSHIKAAIKHLQDALK